MNKTWLKTCLATGSPKPIKTKLYWKNSQQNWFKMPGDLNDQFAEMLREFDVDGDGILEQFKIFSGLFLG